MLHLIHGSTLRVLNPSGKTTGTGFLVTENLAVTCAHVVVAAGAIDGDTIQVQFTGQDEKLSVLVEPAYWRDINKGDVAFLRFVKPIPAELRPLHLGKAKNSHSGNPVYAFGYAKAAEIQGIGARGEFITILPEKGYLQIRSHEADHGSSGAPVLDEKRDVIIGMITQGHTELGRNAETTFATSSELLFQICPEILPSETCPYRGLNAFSETDARFFHGRKRVIARLLDSLQRQPRFLAVLGPSGCGKSSVVQAGLLPALRNGEIFGSNKWQFFTIRPGDNPFIRLHAAGLPDASTGLIAALEMWTETHFQDYPVLILDQFEEIFTTTSEEIREQFLGQMAQLLDGDLPVTIIITLRDDFYSTFTRQNTALTHWLERGQVNVEASLTREELHEMISTPANETGLVFEPGLIDSIINDMTGSKSEGPSTLLPLLEFALTQIWENCAEGLLTHSSYQKMGGVSGGLAARADSAYKAIPERQQQLARYVMTCLVRLGDEKHNLPDTRRKMSFADLIHPGIQENEIRNVVKSLADARLLSTHDEDVEITHEILLQKWPQLRKWLAENRQALMILQRLRENAQEWAESQQKDDSLLYRGWRLKEALSLSSTQTLNFLEQSFLVASQAAVRKELFQKVFLSGGIALAAIIFLILGPAQWIYHEYLRQTILQQSPLVQLQGGIMIFGTDSLYKDEDEPIQERLQVDTFEMEVYEVSNKKYRACFQSGKCSEPQDKTYFDQEKYDQFPVVYVNYYQAETYCNWLGRRLPKSIEWERAARGLDGAPWPWYDPSRPPDSAWNQLSRLKTNIMTIDQPFEEAALVAVGGFPQGMSAEGVYDLFGNVWEWTSTEEGLLTDPAQATFVQRGGSYLSMLTRITQIKSEYPESTDVSVGFRCVK